MPRTPGDRKKSASGPRLATPQEPVEPRSLIRRPFTRRQILLCAVAILTAFVVLGGRESYRILYDPKVYFLLNENGAAWIRANEPCLIKARRAAQTATVFECRFTTAAPVPTAHLTVRAFRRCIVELDRKPLPVRAKDSKAWKEPYEFEIAGPVAPGAHQLQIAVFNSNAHPCVLASSDELGIHSGSDWVVVGNGKRDPAILASQVKLPDEALQYPSVQQGFLSRAPWLAAIFVLALVWTLWNSRSTRLAAPASRWQLTSGRVRWILLGAWVVLAANNIWQIPAWVGPDLLAHFQYVEYIAEHRSLPLATDGWEMFQSPLFYSLAAPWYGLFSSRVNPIVIVKVLRFLPLLCGMAQIEIVYRASRAVFPDNKDLQTLATTIGGLLPINIYSSQVIGNEPLAGCLTALVVLMSLFLLAEPLRHRSTRFFVVMGVVWGLAILAKVTPLLLAPLLIGVIAVYCRNIGDTKRHALALMGLVVGLCVLTAGWWFVRNWAALGTPLPSSQARGNLWWQDPSYRMTTQIASFGISLSRPIFGGVWSMWDTLYSSLWLDGTVSGLTIGPETFPWNVNWMLAGAWLGLVPMAFLLLSPVACLRRELRSSRNALLFALATVAVYLAAILDIYVGHPVLSTAKATYMVGLLPCFGLLAAAGAAPLLRFRLLRAAVYSAVTCWAVAAYLAYFSLNFSLHGWEVGP